MSKKQTKKDQKRLLGRRCRNRKGMAPRRGPGNTTHGHR